MAKKSSSNGDSKQGLIITLVCFIVLSLGLGVAAYYGYADNANDKKKAQEAETKTKSMEKDRSWYKYCYLQLKQLTGILDAKDQNLKERQDLEAKFAKALEEFGDLNKNLGDLARKASDDEIGFGKERKQLLAKIKDFQTQLDKVREQLKPPDMLKYDTPKGQIVRLDPKGEVAWINLGSADNLRASQSITFSIFGASTGGKIGGERKGAVEVVLIRSVLPCASNSSIRGRRSNVQGRSALFVKTKEPSSCPAAPFRSVVRARSKSASWTTTALESALLSLN